MKKTLTNILLVLVFLAGLGLLLYPTVSDYYNLIHRHNINHFYLCRAVSFGETAMTEAEVHTFHLSTLKLTYEQALAEYERCCDGPLGRLIAARELPILKRAKEMLDGMK